MDELAALVAACLPENNKEDDTPRLALADWLDEHDDARGGYVRLWVARYRKEQSPRDHGLQRTYNEKIHQLQSLKEGQDFTFDMREAFPGIESIAPRNPISEYPSWYVQFRGIDKQCNTLSEAWDKVKKEPHTLPRIDNSTFLFPETGFVNEYRLIVPAKTFNHRISKLRKDHPVCAVTISQVTHHNIRSVLDTLQNAGAGFERVHLKLEKHLTAANRVAVMQALGESAALDRIERLDIGSNDLNADALSALLQGGHTAGIKHLDVSCNPIGLSTSNPLSEHADQLRNLESLDASNCNLSCEARDMILGSEGHFPKLRFLNIVENCAPLSPLPASPSRGWGDDVDTERMNPDWPLDQEWLSARFGVGLGTYTNNPEIPMEIRLPALEALFMGTNASPALVNEIQSNLLRPENQVAIPSSLRFIKFGNLFRSRLEIELPQRTVGLTTPTTPRPIDAAMEAERAARQAEHNAPDGPDYSPDAPASRIGGRSLPESRQRDQASPRLGPGGDDATPPR